MGDSVTPETLTDAMIRLLRFDDTTTMADRRWCAVALDEFGMGSKAERRRARQRICDVINARHGAKP